MIATIFLLKISHFLFLGTFLPKCVLYLQISASALVLRHSQSTAQREKVLRFTEQHCRRILFETRGRRHALQLFSASGNSAPNIGQAELKLFILHRIF